MAAIPEMRFLVRCLPSTQGTSQSSLEEELVPLDWEWLVNLAEWHGVFLLFASQALSSKAQATVLQAPELALAQLKTRQIGHLRRGLALTGALLKIQREFDRCGIKILPWKGPSVGSLLYGSPTLRKSNDLDFLFLEKDLPAILESTRGLGYQLAGSYESESKYLYFLMRQGEISFIGQQEQILLEFHSRILPSRFTHWQNAQADIERASTVCQLAGYDVLMQAPEDLLTGLCAHATKHNWDRLKWSCDIAQFLGVYGDKIDWKPFLAGLRRERKDSVVLLGLSLAANLFSLLLPSAVQEALQQSPDVAPLAEAAAAHIMSGTTGTIEVRYQRAMIDLLCPRLRNRIAYILRPIIELNTEDMYIPVRNRMLFFMNYFFRFARLLKKFGPLQLVTKTAASVRSVR